MGRPPCCDKVGVKKGPWTPEEDIMLVSFVQEHGAGNWKSVPTTTGLHRCSKSCRLRWTNYLRPGIRRGGFTDHEEKMIIQLQALLGNKWAAIASYLPERTDNDIKNYWNTHLKKKLRKQQQSGVGDDYVSKIEAFSTSHSVSRGQWEKRLQTDIHTAKQALHQALSFDNIILPEYDVLSSYNNKPSNQTSLYASSTENIAKLLKNWTTNDPIKPDEQSKFTNSNNPFSKNTMSIAHEYSTSSGESSNNKSEVDLSEAFDSLFGFESFDSANSDFSRSSTSPEARQYHDHESKKALLSTEVPVLSVFENWLLSEARNSSIKVKEDLGDFSFDEDNHLF